MAKTVYVPTVAEQALAADRTTGWRVLTRLLGVTAPGDTRSRELDGHQVTETAISFEPPWRVVLDASGGPGAFHQETVVLVPHDGGCLAMWSALVQEPTDAASASYLDAVAARVRPQLEELAAEIA